MENAKCVRHKSNKIMYNNKTILLKGWKLQ